MRYGVGLDWSVPVPDVVAQARRAREAGFASVSASQIFGYDALTLLALVGHEVPDIELMTTVVPIQPRHPMVMAAQALTVQAATGGRLTLGIGLSHQVVVEGMWGYEWAHGALRMREYLEALVPMVHGEHVTFEGRTVKAAMMGPLDIKTTAPQVIVAALGPKMLELAGTLADGTVTWMTGPATVESHIVPGITAAAKAAGRPDPRVVVALPVSVTANPDAARETAAATFAMYGYLPSYRAMLDREGAAGPADVAIVGNEESVATQLKRLVEAGATDFAASPYGPKEDVDRTVALLSELARG